ncbi:2-succinyl-5-enolpyruvyl-6-hydroxy-3-cyclohexene-1-carboxylic-acid synthase [Actinopolyspora erythraea]|uniref:2-succinyl-5-enolpyruvyl-6-hydroxy-3- cyclohexene-1-carboxylic-acid synthase n=1 Tax=Actinopolyspora erythraea TaxID=414996 RepID=UPI000694E6AB|nr:2-succinyl-5-enolpyruvyl-6-hydroxy-3-cyclohexene-1-carboxylic-acid synthase [Actinopolyspora erythraea]
MAIEPNTSATAVVDELLRNNVRDFVYCPGSRNGPIGFALHRLAQSGEIELHVRLDERSAAFVALGLSKGSGRPAAVVTTSGTAVANALPAVCEANHGKVPLVVLSANRPPELLGTGANQTVEQFAFFDGQVVHKVQLGSTRDRDDAVNADLRGHVSAAVLAAGGGFGGAPGPVQIDLPLTSGAPPSSPEVAAPEGRPGGVPWTSGEPAASADLPATTVELSEPTVVIAGDGADLDAVPPEVPVVAEPTVRAAGRNGIHPWALEYLAPRRVVVLGCPTLHRAVSEPLARPGVEVLVESGAVRGGVFASAHADRIGARYRFIGDNPAEWLAEVAEVDRLVRECWQDGLDRTAEEPGGPHVARALLRSVAPGDLVWLGASNPVRDVSLVGDVPDGVEVHSNRGVAGIDGTLGSAIGLALSRPAQRVIAMVGDLTFLHDAASLQFGSLERRPDNLAVVVANDTGGGIFETLEQGAPRFREADFGDAFERLYGTPQRADISALCEAYGVAHRLARAEDLGDPRGLEVVEVPTRRSTLRELHTDVRERVRRAEPHRSVA